MSRPRQPSQSQIRRRRRTALAIVAALLALGAYLVLAATVFAPVDRHGARFAHIEVQSKAVDRQLGVNVIVPANAGPAGTRSLLVFLHGRGGSESTFNDAVFRGLPSLRGRRGAVVAFPAGGVHGYWHDRDDGDWETWVMDEVLPLAIERFGIDPRRLAIGGISMGGFGAYSIALKNPGRFCAVGGHSPALWFDGSETAPGAFDDAADFERHDVVEGVQVDPEAFGDARVWIDYGESDDFRPYDEGFVAALEAGDADFTHRSWPGGHEGSYWDAHWPSYQRFYVNALNHCR
jgi:S-formylglutathione hydrolase FrmB